MCTTRDETLLENLLREPGSHWGEFAERFAPLIEGCVHSSMVPFANREDFVQDVYYELLRNDMSRLRRWDPQKGALPVFLKVVVSRIIVDLFRGRRYRSDPRPVTGDEEGDSDRAWERLESGDSSPREAAELRETWRVLRRELDTLRRHGKAQHVDLLILQGKLLDMDSSEIARITYLSENAVNVRFHRLRKHLMEKVRIEDLPP